MPTIEVNISPDPLLVAVALGKMADEIEHDPGPMASSLEALMASFKRAFAEEGPGWAPWSESYTRSSGRRHGPLPGQAEILTRTGDLRASVSDPANYGVEFDKIEWTGAAAPDYAGFHLEGTEKMPQRYFLKIDEDAESDILRDWMSWMESIVAGGVAEVQTFSGNLFSGSFLTLRDAAGRFLA